MPGKLILCATPIGNLGDITQRVLDALRSADLIAAEDTRGSRKLLAHFDIHTPMISYHENNRFDRGRELVEKMSGGLTVALITDAGTPAISDPGEDLVRMAYDAGIEVTSLPGASACITALTLSGLTTRRFVMEGFLPADKKERGEVLGYLADETRTIIIYEAPHRLIKTLKALEEALGGDRKIALCREMTKKHEEVIRTTIAGAAAYYGDPSAEEAEESAGDGPQRAGANAPRGEYVLVIEGRSRREIEEQKQQEWQKMSVEEHVQLYINQGLDKKEAMKLAARDRGCSKRDIYGIMCGKY